MSRRSAVTLIEVLVSIFIMGIGLLALLTLFPLGSLKMAQAIKDDRSAQAAANAEAAAAFWDVRHNLLATADDSPSPGGVERMFLGPRGWIDLRTRARGLEGPSYPIYVDPFGVLGMAGRTTAIGALPGMNSPGIPRRRVTFGDTLAEAQRWFALQDDINFNSNGQPDMPGGQVQRDARYTWAYLVRRPHIKVPALVEMSIIVYRGRPLQLPPGEPTYGPVTFDPNSNSVQVAYDPATQPRPPVRRGGWILDATIYNEARQPDPHGYFYRVVNVTDLGGTGGQAVVVLDLEDRPRRGTNQGVLVVMEYVVEVFENAGGWKP